MKFANSKNPSERNAKTDAKIAALLDKPPEAPVAAHGDQSIVLVTRIRLARNLAENPFPGWAKEAQRGAILAKCEDAVSRIPQMKRSTTLKMTELTEVERDVLVERHIISRELSASKQGSGVIISRDLGSAVMINEEDHLRIAVLKPGLQLKRLWSAISAIDDALEDTLDYAFNAKLGYLTACPTNLGTALRASSMMHLPAMVITGQMEKVVRAVNQLGLVVRGLHGEGSDASGSIFQISNQTTLGESEASILKRLSGVLETIVDQEVNARERLLDGDARKLYDKIGRAYGLLKNSYVLSSTEALNLLSLVRLGAGVGVFPENSRPRIDQLFTLCQAGHIQYAEKTAKAAPERDTFRATMLRAEFENFTRPDFNLSGKN
ncbi:MAG TPA: protein arginine kinase [Opitutaceae bacterium]|nr:protein arginine kinase [Opitutaceae bacterium]